MIRRILTLVCMALAFVGAQAQTLTPAQIQTLRTSILADSALAPSCTQFGDGPFIIAAAYNQAASPAWYAYRTNVTLGEIGDAFSGTDLAGLTTANLQRLQVIQQYTTNVISFARADRRQFFLDVFSGAGGTTTRANLAAIWSRQVTRLERLYATGTGTTVTPGSTGVEGNLSASVVIQACYQ